MHHEAHFELWKWIRDQSTADISIPVRIAALRWLLGKEYDDLRQAYKNNNQAIIAACYCGCPAGSLLYVNGKHALPIASRHLQCPREQRLRDHRLYLATADLDMPRCALCNTGAPNHQHWLTVCPATLKFLDVILGTQFEHYGIHHLEMKLRKKFVISLLSLRLYTKAFGSTANCAKNDIGKVDTHVARLIHHYHNNVDNSDDINIQEPPSAGAREILDLETGQRVDALCAATDLPKDITLVEWSPGDNVGIDSFKGCYYRGAWLPPPLQGDESNATWRVTISTGNKPLYELVTTCPTAAGDLVIVKSKVTDAKDILVAQFDGSYVSRTDPPTAGIGIVILLRHMTNGTVEEKLIREISMPVQASSELAAEQAAALFTVTVLTHSRRNVMHSAPGLQNHCRRRLHAGH